MDLSSFPFRCRPKFAVPQSGHLETLQDKSTTRSPTMSRSSTPIPLSFFLVDRLLKLALFPSTSARVATDKKKGSDRGVYLPSFADTPGLFDHRDRVSFTRQPTIFSSQRVGFTSACTCVPHIRDGDTRERPVYVRREMRDRDALCIPTREARASPPSRSRSHHELCRYVPACRSVINGISSAGIPPIRSTRGITVSLSLSLFAPLPLGLFPLLPPPSPRIRRPRPALSAALSL